MGIVLGVVNFVSIMYGDDFVVKDVVVRCEGRGYSCGLDVIVFDECGGSLFLCCNIDVVFVDFYLFEGSRVSIGVVIVVFCDVGKYGIKVRFGLVSLLEVDSFVSCDGSGDGIRVGVFVVVDIDVVVFVGIDEVVIKVFGVLGGNVGDRLVVLFYVEVFEEEFVVFGVVCGKVWDSVVGDGRGGENVNYGNGGGFEGYFDRIGGRIWGCLSFLRWERMWKWM